MIEPNIKFSEAAIWQDRCWPASSRPGTFCAGGLAGAWGIRRASFLAALAGLCGDVGPVSNSGRLSEILREVATEHGWDWQTEIVNDPDSLLRSSEEIVVSADGGIIDECRQWVNLALEVVERELPDAEIVRFDA